MSARRPDEPSLFDSPVSEGGAPPPPPGSTNVALHEMPQWSSLDYLFIENVGNLVCPAVYDLGQDVNVVALSIAEGEDKPLKYPTIFNSADLAILTKIDLAAVVGFAREDAIANIREVAPQLPVCELSARSGEGMDAWLAQLQLVRMATVLDRSPAI